MTPTAAAWKCSAISARCKRIRRSSACPIPASSGKTVRHRLNRGGDRQANSALHEIARQRVMRDPETAEYAERARGRGKSDREVMRCLKRYVAREAYGR